MNSAETCQGLSLLFSSGTIALTMENNSHAQIGVYVSEHV